MHCPFLHRRVGLAAINYDVHYKNIINWLIVCSVFIINFRAQEDILRKIQVTYHSISLYVQFHLLLVECISIMHVHVQIDVQKRCMGKTRLPPSINAGFSSINVGLCTSEWGRREIIAGDCFTNAVCRQKERKVSWI